LLGKFNQCWLGTSLMKYNVIGDSICMIAMWSCLKEKEKDYYKNADSLLNSFRRK